MNRVFQATVYFTEDAIKSLNEFGSETEQQVGIKTLATNYFPAYVSKKDIAELIFGGENV